MHDISIEGQINAYQFATGAEERAIPSRQIESFLFTSTTTNIKVSK